MRASVILSIATGLSIAGIGPAGADPDVGVWRWYVSNALRAQQGADVQRLQEGRASAIDWSAGFVQRYERYSADGAALATGDLVKR